MSNKVAELKNAIGAGARINKYRVNFTIPSAVATQSDLSQTAVLCRSTSFPGKTTAQIDVFSQGRKLVLPGDTSYTNNWTLTFYQTEAHDLRRDIIEWMKSCDHFQNNEHSGDPGSVMTEMSVEQLDSKANPTAMYTFHNVFPTELSEISLNSDTDAGVIEFDVTFSFTDWVSGSGEFEGAFDANPATKNPVAE